MVAIEWIVTTFFSVHKIHLNNILPRTECQSAKISREKVRPPLTKENTSENTVDDE